MGREFGFLEIHSNHQEAVQYTGKKALESIGLKEVDRLKPRVLSSNMTTGIHPHEAQLINARNAGGLVLAYETFCVIEVVPAAYIVLAANEAEKAAGITHNSRACADIKSTSRWTANWLPSHCCVNVIGMRLRSP